MFTIIPIWGSRLGKLFVRQYKQMTDIYYWFKDNSKIF